MPWKDGYTISDEVGLADGAIVWPEGKRCAVHIVVSLSVATGPDGITTADLAQSPAQFGLGEGLELLRGVLRKHCLSATFAVPALIAQAFPGKITSLARDGHEIAAMGLKHEDVSGLARDDELARIGLAGDIISSVTGSRPRGWYSLPRPRDPFAGGTISRNTIDLLIDAGFAYFGNGLADDAPHYWVTDFSHRRHMLALPYYYHFDDQYFCMFPHKGTGLENSDMLARNWQAELAAQYKRGRFFTMTLHPQHVGWCNRLQLLDAFLTRMVQMPGLWVTTGTACARHWHANYPAATHLTLEPSIWQDYPGSLS